MTSGLRKIVFFILVVGVALIAYQYMIKPANEHLAEAKLRVSVKLEKLKEFEEATAAAENLTKQLEQLQEAIDFFESKLPPTSEIHKVLKNVTVIAQQRGLLPKAIKTEKIENNSGYVEQPLKMQLVGNFNSFYSFLLEIEKLPRIMQISKLKLEKQKDQEGQITADLVVSIYFQNKQA